LASGQTQKTEVLTLGTFHFNFPNLVIKKINKNDQINVFDPKYQKEIENIVTRIARISTTIIAIEQGPVKQAKYDSLYDKYIQGEYQLSRNEEEQIGFRLAKRLGLKKLYCVAGWGKDYEYLNSVLEEKDSVENKRFMDYFYKHPDTAKQFFTRQLFKSQGILAELRERNDAANIKKDLGNYLIGIFKYETKDNEYFGPDFVTGWWFNRNLRIFRNIQKIHAKSTDKILIIYGAGHLNLLNLFFECSPEYRLVKTSEYLK
jgi:hypothetical protein